MGNFYVAFKSSRDTQAMAIAAAKKGNIDHEVMVHIIQYVFNFLSFLSDQSSGRNNRSAAAASAQWAFERMMMKGRLSWLLIYVLPLFPITYLLGYIGVFDRDQVIASNMICSVFAKLVFVGILSLESLFVQLAQRNSDVRKKALNNATIEGFSLLRGGPSMASKNAYGTNLNPKYDSLNQVNSVEDEVNFSLVKIQNEAALGYKNGTKGGNLGGKGNLKSASDGPLNDGKPSVITTEPGRGVSTGKLAINI